MNSSDLETIKNFYNTRFVDFGLSHKTVGWGSRDQQLLRFKMLFRGISPIGKTILDVGCGLGDMVTYLEEITAGDFRYVGIDIADSLIYKAKDIHNSSNCQFMVGDPLSTPLEDVDIAVLSGALTYKFIGVEAYAQQVMKKLFTVSREVVSLNFMNKYSDYELDKNQHYYPEILLKWAFELTNNVNLIADYPLYEFTIQLKQPW